ncbi:superoxide dismutase family protein [Flavobacterium sp. N1994]|uniref:superoxide dismutase family protein n=1 Tax=Flavobacterium sp. N1994 TaxID=2986827 RepID=UPI002222349F|nr:superoxide dismutase family protein [Flavobacterium sp. N1994]
MKKVFLGLTVVGLLIFSCKSSSTADKAKTINLTLETKSNSGVTGTADFVEKNGEVTLTAKLTGLKPGTHGIHIHEKADCSAADAASAGGHWNPTFKKHGKWTDAEHHKGDIGNFEADASGKATITFKTNEWCIGCGDATKDILGKGLIVHDKADDFVTQPSGNAGARVACSAIIQ